MGLRILGGGWPGSEIEITTYVVRTTIPRSISSLLAIMNSTACPHQFQRFLSSFAKSRRFLARRFPAFNSGDRGTRNARAGKIDVAIDNIR